MGALSSRVQPFPQPCPQDQASSVPTAHHLLVHFPLPSPALLGSAPREHFPSPPLPCWAPHPESTFLPLPRCWS